MNLLITGSRDYWRLPLVEAVLYSFITTDPIPGRKGEPVKQMFVGDAKGVDREAARVWRKYRKNDPEIFRANWIIHGKSAGPRRNAEMLKAFHKAGGGIVIAFWDGKSPGTLNMIRQVIKDGTNGVMLPCGYERVDYKESKGDLKLRYCNSEDDLEKLITEWRG